MVVVVAMAANRIIGAHNRIPWHFPEDTQWFKQQTLGKTLLMGRKTFDSIGRPLPQRTTIVLSRQSGTTSGAMRIQSLNDIGTVAPGLTELVVCGGAEIYALTQPFWNELWVTRLKQPFLGDASFPEFETDYPEPQILRETPDFTIQHYRR